MRCQHCGAIISDTALECGACRAPTPFAAAERARQAAHAQAHAYAAAQAHHQRVHAAQQRVDSAATQSIVLAVVSFVLCCAPTAIVGAVQGARARSMAREAGLVAPTRAIVGLVFSVVATLTSIAIFTWAIIDAQHGEERAAKRIAKLERASAEGVKATTLNHDTACALAEAHALKVGWDGHPGYALEKFACDGALAGDGARAELEDFEFFPSSDRTRVRVCFRRGAKWYVDKLAAGACDDPDDAKSAKGSPASPPKASAAPSK